MSMSQVSLICSRTCGGRGILAVSLQTPQLQTKRNGSDDVKFLTKTDMGSLKRGRGGRSSFSGIVATVFGATGFFGPYLCNKLGKSGTQMIIPYRGDSYETRDLKVAGDLGQVLFQPFYLLDEESIRKSVKHSDVVINMIGRDWETRNFTYNQAHVDGAARIARISKEMGVEKFIHISALNSDRPHKGYNEAGGSRFLQSKGAGEQAVREIFPEATIFRPSDTFGVEDRFIQYFAKSVRRQFHDKSIFIPHNGKDIWKQPVYVADIAQGIVNAIMNDDAIGKTYAAVGPRRYELAELIDWTLRITRRHEVKRYDMKWNPFFYYAAKANERFSLSNPYGMIIPDKLEREAVSDVTDELPNLTDLGVKLTLLEDIIEWQLSGLYRHQSYYFEKVGEFDHPAPAKFIEAA